MTGVAVAPVSSEASCRCCCCCCCCCCCWSFVHGLLKGRAGLMTQYHIIQTCVPPSWGASSEYCNVYHGTTAENEKSPGRFPSGMPGIVRIYIPHNNAGDTYTYNIHKERKRIVAGWGRNKQKNVPCFLPPGERHRAYMILLQQLV